MFYWKLNIDFIKFIFCFLMKPFGGTKTVYCDSEWTILSWFSLDTNSCRILPSVTCPGYSYFIDTSFLQRHHLLSPLIPFHQKTKTTPVISIQLASSDCSTTWKCLQNESGGYRCQLTLGLCAAMGIYFHLNRYKSPRIWLLLSNLGNHHILKKAVALKFIYCFKWKWCAPLSQS